MSSPASRACITALLCFFVPRVALAEGGFAEPPGRPLVPEPRPYDSYQGPDEPRPIQPSTVRVSVGPTLRFSEADADGGLYVAMDIGARAAGVRASGAWVRSGAEHGMSQYAAELWIDFGVGRELHPVIAAGAGIARLEDTTLGIGVLRASLDYVLPVAGVDARVGIDAIGNVPATPGGDPSDARPWFFAVGHVGVGF
jgi:hypothetical protein